MLIYSITIGWKMKNKIIEELDRIFPNPKCPLNYSKDYELLLAVMLSAQTTDERVNEVTKNLFKYDIRQLANMDVWLIEEIVRPVGTQKRKANYIKAICKSLIENSSGAVPYDRDYIESLPGVGHKTCNVVFSELFGEPNFAVDTHVSRVSKRLGLASEKDDVHTIEKKLCAYFPKEYHRKLHIQFVLFGRNICLARNPKCDICPFKSKCKRALQ